MSGRDWLDVEMFFNSVCDERDALQSDLATAEQDSRQKQARIERLEGVVKGTLRIAAHEAASEIENLRADQLFTKAPEVK
jgi:hypothetical protein